MVEGSKGSANADVREIELSDIIQNLRRRGTANGGYVTYEELNQILPSNIAEAIQSDKYLKILEALGVQVIRQEDVKKFLETTDAKKPDAEKPRSEEDADPIQMYLHQMNQVRTLKREEEIELFKQIEESEARVRDLFNRFLFAPGMYWSLLDKLENYSECFERAVTPKKGSCLKRSQRKVYSKNIPMFRKLRCPSRMGCGLDTASSKTVDCVEDSKENHSGEKFGPLGKHVGKRVTTSTPKKPDEQDYCMLSNVEKESAKCVFPMVLCMAGRKNCKIVNNWGEVFDALKDYISAHQDALDKIKEYMDWIERYRDRMKRYKGKEYLNKDPRFKTWLLGVSRGMDNRDRLHMKRERAGLLPRRIAQLSRMVGLRACVIVVSKKQIDRPSAFKSRNLLAKARKLLPGLRCWLGLDM